MSKTFSDFLDGLEKQETSHRAVQVGLWRLLDAIDALRNSSYDLDALADDIDLPTLLESPGRPTREVTDRITRLVTSSGVCGEQARTVMGMLAQELERQAAMIKWTGRSASDPLDNAPELTDAEIPERPIKNTVDDGVDDDDLPARREPYNRTWQCDRCGGHFRWTQVKECPECGIPWNNFR